MNKSPNLSAEAKRGRPFRLSAAAGRQQEGVSGVGGQLSSAGACNAIMSRGRSWELQDGGAGSGSQRFLAGARTDRGAEALDDRRSQQLGAVPRVTRERTSWRESVCTLPWCLLPRCARPPSSLSRCRWGDFRGVTQGKEELGQLGDSRWGGRDGIGISTDHILQFRHLVLLRV